MRFELTDDQLALVKTSLELLEAAAKIPAADPQEIVNGFVLFSIESLIVDLEHQEAAQ